MSLTDEQRRMLEESIPPHLIEQKKGLDYVPAGWVIAEANRIFGPTGWGHEVTRSEIWSEEGKGRDGKPRLERHAMVTVRVFVYGPDGREFSHGGQACGTGYGPDGPHQAAAEAETDAIKRALSKYGRRLGLQLYLSDKHDTRPMPGDMPAKIVGALEGANGDAAKLVRIARARLSEYAATPEQRREIEQAIARVEARA